MIGNRNVLNVCGAAINHATVLAALAKSNLHWEMHQAQVYSLEMAMFIESSEVTAVVSEDMTRELLSRPQTNITLMGLPVIIDNERYPKGLVRLMSGDTELSRIEALAIPSVFMNGIDWDLDQRIEREKFCKLTY